MKDILDAAVSGDTAQVASILDNDPSQIEFQPFGETPLSIAVRRDKAEVVKLLLDRGANANHRGNNGRTPLHSVADGGELDIATILLSHQPDVEALDDMGRSPLQMAAIMGHNDVAQLLIEHGAVYDIATAVILGDVSRVREIIRIDPTAISRCRFKNDLLTDAVVSQNLELLRLLLEHPDIVTTAIGTTGEPPLVAAVSRSDYSPEIVKELMAHGADPTQKSSSGDTAFARAQSVGIPNPDILLRLA